MSHFGLVFKLDIDIYVITEDLQEDFIHLVVVHSLQSSSQLFFAKIYLVKALIAPANRPFSFFAIHSFIYPLRLRALNAKETSA